MNEEQLQSKIQKFWEWFVENEAHLVESEDLDAVKTALDNQILAFGMFKWELSQEPPYYLMISPNGNPDLLKISSSIVKAAPYLRHWEFYSSKPPQDWDFLFEMFDSWMEKTRIDASDWKYVLLEFDDGEIDLEILTPDLLDMDEEDQNIAMELVVTNILGEAIRIKHINEIRFSVEFAPEFEEAAATMPQLAQHVSEVLKSH